MTKILIIGGGSQLGSELVKLFADSKASYHSPDSKDQLKIDLTDPTGTESTILKEEPDIIVNSAAFVEVDRCEEENEYAYKVNSLGVKHIVRAASILDSYLVHVSTDYVFDGEKGQYSEESVPNPINYYGFSKMMGDAFAMSYDHSLIVRTSGVFGNKRNFPRFVLERLMSGKDVSVIEGYYSPISAKKLAEGIKHAIDLRLHGILNVAGQRTSRIDLAKMIADQFNLDGTLVKGMDASEMKFKAQRPYDSSLDIRRAMNLLPNHIFDPVENVRALSSHGGDRTNSGGSR